MLRLWIIRFQSLGASTLILRSELGFHFEFLLLAPSSLLKKILFCFSGNWVGYFTFWLLNMTTKEHIRNGFYNWTFTNHFLYKHFANLGNIKFWQNIFLKISFDDLRLCLLITAQTTEKFGGCRSSSGVYDFSLGFLNRGRPFYPTETSVALRLNWSSWNSSGYMTSLGSFETRISLYPTVTTVAWDSIDAAAEKLQSESRLTWKIPGTCLSKAEWLEGYGPGRLIDRFKTSQLCKNDRRSKCSSQNICAFLPRWVNIFNDVFTRRSKPAVWSPLPLGVPGSALMVDEELRGHDEVPSLVF